jgi:glycosyltransferase involved in cell wall biosynthesis
LGIKPENVNEQVIPGFIPPIVKAEEIAQISQEVWDFIHSHSPILTANAFRISFYDGQDLYGIDLCIYLCTDLKANYPRIGFVFCLPDIGDHKYFSKMREKIRDCKVEDNFLFVTKPCPYYPILSKSDVFVRPTNTDGDAISLREALYFKVPAVASDAVVRPEGTILFKNRDVDDFTAKVRHVLDDYESSKERLETVKLEDNFEKLLRLLL